jgi:hypothetical protein
MTACRYNEDMEKTKISLAMLNGEVEVRGARILIPFDTNHSKFSLEIPRRAMLVFEGFKNADGKLEYKFRGVDAQCYCESCMSKVEKRKIKP